METKVKTLIIIPAFNEGKNIYNIIREIVKVYPDFDIAVINDGSIDNTVSEVKKSDVFLVNHPFNLGYGVAIQTGYKFAKENNYDYLIQIDGDGQHDIKNLGTIYEKLIELNYDLVLGSRFTSKESYTPSFIRRCGMKLFRFVVNKITGLGLTDITTGFQGMNKKTLSIFVKDSFPFDYPDADVLVLAYKKGLRITEVPVKMYMNQTGQSMHSGIIKNFLYVIQMFISLFILLLQKRDKVQ